jgi:hypothetical protein
VKRTLVITAAVLAIVLVGRVVAAPGPNHAPVQPRSNMSVAESREFRDFPLFDVGKSFRGLDRTAIVRFLQAPSDSRVTPNWVSFIYGTCAPSGSESSCAPPLAIQIWPACERNPSVYSPEIRASAKQVLVHGVPALDFSAVEDARLELYTGRSTVVIFGQSHDAVLEAANLLRPAGSAQTVKIPTLPPPAAGALDGRLGC